MSQISATIIADSVSEAGQRITTFELVYPRWIHGELLTHRMFSRNAMSSRAVPIEKMIEQVRNDPAMPIHWGKNQSGMQAKQELTDTSHVSYYWEELAREVAGYADYFSRQNLHKQVVNRILEPFQLMKTVLTATELNNFFWLRNHGDAQPEIKKLAELMWEALQKSTPKKLQYGDWHLPYFGQGFWVKDWPYAIKYGTQEDGSEDEYLELKDALAISSSCCAQVSYRKLDDSLDKAKRVYERLVESEPVHASPFEHCATPMKEPKQTDKYLWEDGMTHMDKSGAMWSGNLKGFIQYRQLIKGNVKNG